MSYPYVKWNSFGRGLLASGLIIRAYFESRWALPKRRLATPGAPRLGGSGGSDTLGRFPASGISGGRDVSKDGPIGPREPFLESQGTSFTGARQNVAFCPVGSNTLTWQSYMPGASSFSGILKFKGIVLRRFVIPSTTLIGCVSKAFV
jgi:hypothetical protein